MTSFSDGGRNLRRRVDELSFAGNGNQQAPARPAVLFLQPSQGARLDFSTLAAHAPQDPVVEDYQPEIHRAVAHPENVTIQRPASAGQDDVLPPVYLLRESGATQAYALLPKIPVSLDHHAPGWGCVLFAIIYKRVGDSTVFQAPEYPEYVAIKRLSKAVVARQMALGGEENPYKEIHRMQELYDGGLHVLPCIEALQDDEYLYIVTPKACNEGTLKDAIPWTQEGLEPDRARFIFVQILKILLYLETHSICHHDLSPDNFLFLSRDHLVVFDLALSLRIPVSESTGHRTLLKPVGNFGTRAWQPPEVYRDRVFDGVSCDLWSCTVILYNILTGQVLCELPHPTDISFRYFVLAGGLSSRPINERTVEILMDTFGQDEQEGRGQHMLLNQAIAHLNLSPAAVELFEHVFAIQPTERWTLAQAIESPYVQADAWR